MKTIKIKNKITKIKVSLEIFNSVFKTVQDSINELEELGVYRSVDEALVQLPVSSKKKKDLVHLQRAQKNVFHLNRKKIN